jgi:hypothetical protein
MSYVIDLYKQQALSIQNHRTTHLQQLEDEVCCRVCDEVGHVEAARQRAPESVPGVT